MSYSLSAQKSNTVPKTKNYILVRHLPYSWFHPIGTVVCCVPGTNVDSCDCVVIIVNVITNHVSRLVFRNDPEVKWLPQSMYYALNGPNSAVDGYT